jgi:hypothetical protein
MPRFEQMRDRLPSLYRPSDDDGEGEPMPLRVADLLQVNGQPLPAGAVSGAEGVLTVELPAPLPIRSLRLAPGTTRGSLSVLELYALANGSAPQLPSATARLQRDVGSPATHFQAQRFQLRLRRPGLLSRYLWSIAQLLEELNREATEVMQAHWLDFADQARFSPYFLRGRELQLLPPPALRDPELVRFPYIDDLSRLGSLLSLLPWREPATHRESVEAYRGRIRRVVALYRNGLGTVEALRAMVEVQLPVDLAQPPGLRDLPFTLEEFAPLVASRLAVQGRGPPPDMVGPLMRWSMLNDGIGSAAPTLYIQGVEPQPDRIDATERPLIELFAAAGERRRLGIAYEGTLAPGQTLRLRPAHAFWLGRADGLRLAESLPTDSLPADPTAPGPWLPAGDAPGDAVTALHQARDHTLWAATDAGEGAALWRFDGTGWTEVLTNLPPVHCLAQDEDDLLLGTESGLLRLPLHPPEGDALAPAPDPGTLEGPAVHGLLRASDGRWYVGTATGLARLGADDALESFGLGEDEDTRVAVYSVAQDETGSLHLGTELGLFRYQPGLDHWYVYRGEERSDQHPDWQRFRPGESDAARDLPAAERLFLPPVRCVLRGPDASLWVGTDAGIARYVARPVRGLSYTTLLEAFPDLASGRVRAIRQDARGAVWFATEQGLFRFDGRDWWQAQGDALVRLALGESAPADPSKPRFWRFNRTLERWESFDTGTRTTTWQAFTGAPQGTAEDAVTALLWTDRAVAELGEWDGERFTPDTDAEPAALRMRYKPTEDRIMDGGIPAVPALPPGESEWRYLALEPETVPEPAITPAWTVEGRLLPPPDRDAVREGRHSGNAPLDLSHFDDAAFAFNPAARVWLSWEARRPLAVLARLRTTAADEHIDPAILDRVWEGIEQVRPAGVRALLAVDEKIVRP